MVRKVAIWALATVLVSEGCASPATQGAEGSPEGGAVTTAGSLEAMQGTLYAPGRRFGQVYCAPCHAKDGRDPKQAVAYPAFHVDTYEDWASSQTILLAVLDKWNPDGDVMPPPDAIEPSDEERRLILDWIRRGSPNAMDGR